MGDLVHALPAVSDLLRARPSVVVDWVAEEGFAAVPALHPGVRRVIPIAIRRWRRDPFSRATRHEARAALEALRAERYDRVVDCQGLIKSALVARLAHGERWGYDASSAREGLASFFYRHRVRVKRALPAVERNRRVVAAACDYTPDGAPVFGVRAEPLKAAWLPQRPYAVLMPSASRPQKLWSEPYWVGIARQLEAARLACLLFWGNAEERERAERLAAQLTHAVLAPRLPLMEVARVLAGSRAVVGLDSGLTHLAAALGRPTVGIFCDHSPLLTPVTGPAYTASLGDKGTPPAYEAVADAVRALLASCDAPTAAR